MDEERKWHLASLQLDAFAEHLPNPIEENHVVEFHGILDLSTMPLARTFLLFGFLTKN